MEQRREPGLGRYFLSTSFFWRNKRASPHFRKLQIICDLLPPSLNRAIRIKSQSVGRPCLLKIFCSSSSTKDNVFFSKKKGQRRRTSVISSRRIRAKETAKREGVLGFQVACMLRLTLLWLIYIPLPGNVVVEFCWSVNWRWRCLGLLQWAKMQMNICSTEASLNFLSLAANYFVSRDIAVQDSPKLYCLFSIKGKYPSTRRLHERSLQFSYSPWSWSAIAQHNRHHHWSHSNQYNNRMWGKLISTSHDATHTSRLFST